MGVAPGRDLHAIEIGQARDAGIVNACCIDTQNDSVAAGAGSAGGYCEYRASHPPKTPPAA